MIGEIKMESTEIMGEINIGLKKNLIKNTIVYNVSLLHHAANWIWSIFI